MVIQIETGKVVAVALVAVVFVVAEAYLSYSAGKNNQKNVIVLREDAIKGKYTIIQFVTKIDGRFWFLTEREDHQIIILSSKEDITTPYVIVM